MIIIDSRAAKIKKIIIVVAIAAIAAEIILAIWLMQGSNQVNKVGEPNGAGEAQGDKFSPDLGGCLKYFSGLDKMPTEAVKLKEKEIVEMDIGKASGYYLCLSLKNNNIQYCDALNTNEDALKNCQNGFSEYARTIFPALKANRCDAEFIDACKNTGTINCESLCRGLILRDMAECNNDDLSKDPLMKNMCLAINKDDVNICNSANEDDRKNCQEVFYFFKAARENNVSYLDKIEDVNFRSIAQLYFDPKAQCEKILARFGEYACNERYSRQLLETPGSQTGEPQKNEVK